VAGWVRVAELTEREVFRGGAVAAEPWTLVGVGASRGKGTERGMFRIGQPTYSLKVILLRVRQKQKAKN